MRSLFQCSVLCIILTTPIAGPGEDIKNAPEDSMATTNCLVRHERFDRYLGRQFPVGFYIYPYHFKQSTDPTVRDLDEAINRIADLGFNYLYIGLPDDHDWDNLLELCTTRHIAMVPQLNFAYFRPDSQINSLLERAMPFIRKYKDHPAVIAFSVKEEPNEKMFPLLTQYYQGILKEVPDAPLHLTYVNHFLKTPPYPQIAGADRYGFWWECGAGGNNRATPASALKWYHTQLDFYYQHAVQQNAEFQAIFNPSPLEMFTSEEKLRSQFYPETITDSRRQELTEMVIRLAEKKNQGWNREEPDLFRFWKYYTPPANCVRAMSWLSVMEGAKSVAVWYWGPGVEEINRKKRIERKDSLVSITGWDGKGSPQLDEYAEFASEIQRYGKLIRSMMKEIAPLVGNSLGHEIVRMEEPVSPPFKIRNPDAVWRSFRIPGYQGRVIMIVNTSVGKWCKGRSPFMLSEHDRFRIDDNGNLVDYKPFVREQYLECALLMRDMKCVDLATGDFIAMDENDMFSISVRPGGGQFLFICPKSSSEDQKIKRQFGF